MACFKSAFSHPGLDRLAAMHAQIVQNQQDLFACIFHERFKKSGLARMPGRASVVEAVAGVLPISQFVGIWG